MALVQQDHDDEYITVAQFLERVRPGEELDQSWRASAACKPPGEGTFYTEIFYSEGDLRGAQVAQAFCRDCPVKVQCDEYAAANNERWGRWGAISQTRRRKGDRLGSVGRSVAVIRTSGASTRLA